jgi:hypothetical protein
MKTLTSILLVSLLATGVCLALDQSPTVVRTEVIGVTVSQVEMLSVPATATLTLSTNCPDATRYGRAQLNQCEGSGLSFTQNSGTHKIVAQAVHDAGNAANDMMICCAVDGVDEVVLVDNGADTGPQNLWTGIAPGGYNEILTWTADGSIAGTPSGAYAWTVTFTAMADE